MRKSGRTCNSASLYCEYRSLSCQAIVVAPRLLQSMGASVTYMLAYDALLKFTARRVVGAGSAQNHSAQSHPCSAITGRDYHTRAS